MPQLGVGGHIECIVYLWSHDAAAHDFGRYVGLDEVWGHKVPTEVDLLQACFVGHVVEQLNQVSTGQLGETVHQVPSLQLL